MFISFSNNKNLSSRGLDDDDDDDDDGDGDDYKNQTESYSLSQNVTYVNVFVLKCILPYILNIYRQINHRKFNNCKSVLTIKW